MKNNNIQKQRKIWFLLLNNFRATILLLALGFALNVAFTTSPNTTQKTRNIGGIEVIEMAIDGVPRLFIRVGGTTEEPLFQEVIEFIENGETQLIVLEGLIVLDELNLTSPTNVSPVAPPLNTTQGTRNIGGIEVIEMTIDGVPRLFIRAGGTTEEPLFQEVVEFIENGETQLIALGGLIVLDEFVIPDPVENPVSSIVKLPISATVMYDAERAYFFKGDEYIRYSVSENRVPEGYPQKIQGNWHNWPSNFVDIDAAVMYDAERAYFFKGDEYIRYNVGENRVPDGYPQKIQGNWHNWPSNFVDIDAAVMYDAERAYFFKGDEYIRYNVGENRVPDGYPQKIQGNWHNWPSHFVNIDAAVMYNAESAYFFKGDEYIRYSVSENRVPDGYPKKIQGDWHGFVR